MRQTLWDGVNGQNSEGLLPRFKAQLNHFVAVHLGQVTECVSVSTALLIKWE